MSLDEKRAAFIPQIPKLLVNVEEITFVEEKNLLENREISSLFPHTFGKPLLTFQKGTIKKRKGRRVGAVFSGGQAPGGHNVLWGLLETLQRGHKDSSLVGFLNGPDGILEAKFREISMPCLQKYRNRGGFDMLGSGRTKIETAEDKKKALQTCQQLGLDGLVIIGGDDSNTNAAFLAEYFTAAGEEIAVVGVPKTIDGDLQGEDIPISFGFDTATKLYAELIGNIARDALSAKKYYHFIRLMGRSASHVAMECALKTRPNLTLLSEECLAKKRSLGDVVEEIVLLIERREKKGLFHGVILIPEGLLEFLPEMKSLLQVMSDLLAKHTNVEIKELLPSKEKALFLSLPKEIQEQILMDRDPHGNVQVSKIATEQLLIQMTQKKLRERGIFQGKFCPVSHFLGYEGRASAPSNFDANYCYSLGAIAAFLLQEGRSGYMATCKDLHLPPVSWQPKALPITSLMNIERRKGKEKAVIKKSLVDFSSEAYLFFQERREAWKEEDHYESPGPIQFFGDTDIVDSFPLSLRR